MNFELIGGAALPTVNQAILDEGLVTKVEFDATGSFFAVGHHDGRILVWDFRSRTLSRCLLAHVRPVTSISWTPDSKRLLSTSTDYNLLLWDLETGQLLRRKTFESPVVWAGLNPSNNDWAAVSRLYSPPFLYNLSTGELQLIGDGKDETWSLPALAVTKNNLWLGTGEGVLRRLGWESLAVEEEVRPCDSQIRSVHFSRDGSRYLVIAADRTLRCFTAGHVATTSAIKSDVNQFQWKAAVFSGTGDYVACGSATDPTVCIYGSEGAEAASILVQLSIPEGITALAWQPHSPVLLTASTAGRLYIWTPPGPDGFHCWDPHFLDLEHNIIYQEEETEFDTGFVPYQATRGYLQKEIDNSPVDVDGEAGQTPVCRISVAVEPD